MCPTDEHKNLKRTLTYCVDIHIRNVLAAVGTPYGLFQITVETSINAIQACVLKSHPGH